MTAELACESCGAELPPRSRFCNECGAAVAPATSPAEYKQVTVLFADVVRSMRIAAAVDMERLREIMTDLVEHSAAVVRRYGGTVEFTGDGVMAIFGAPMALEDHALRACLAALAIQEEANRLASEVLRRDAVDLRLRVGLNSGQVIAGEIGSGVLGYAAIGEQVGMAQRMESVAPPGGVMLSESTSRLVEHAAVLADTELMTIKGRNEPVPVRRLLGIGPPRALVGRTEAGLVGRRWELTAVEEIVDRAIGGRGGVVNVVGAPGIGKSRMAREASSAAAARGVEVLWTFCESHARDVPLHAVTELLREGLGVADLAADAARARVRERMPDADAEDLLLLDDLLGIADPEVTRPRLDPGARRRRVIALINAVSLARTEPALFVVEDAQWIDEVSESMLADLLDVIAHIPSVVLITARPEYRGALTRIPGAQTIALAPLSDSDTVALLDELLGVDGSVAPVRGLVAERAAGNPFFAEEMVRELAQRGVLAGRRGRYVCGADVAGISVPATVQAAIEARIDRLTGRAKQAITAASVIGARFDTELLAALGIDAPLDELLGAELIDRVHFTAGTEYAFHHPLIRAVAYESQLKSDRVRWHRRLATAIESGDPDSTDQNAALIAEHLDAAGELHAAYGWHMRAAAWATDRDVDAARISWERARKIADALPDDDPARLSMRIAPRTMLCATRALARRVQESSDRFTELRELCAAAGDTRSLAIGMTGPATELFYAGRSREAARLISEQLALLESIGDPALTVGLGLFAFAAWYEIGEFGEILRWSHTVIDLAAGDPDMGAGFGFGSPLAIAVAWRGTARWWLGRPGWRRDLHDAVAMARRSTTMNLCGVVLWTYGFAVQYGALRADDSVLRVIEEAVQTAERAGDDIALSLAEYTLAVGLLNRDAAADRDRGLDLMMQARDIWLRTRVVGQMFPIVEVYAAGERARGGDRDAAIPVMRQAVNEQYEAGRVASGLLGTGVLVETLLERGTEGDLAEAHEAIDRLATLPEAEGWAIREVILLRLRALLAWAQGDDSYRDLVGQYRAVAESLGFEGHLAWAEAM
ncbi:adenylate/guanylate cyclase domain-containing protein [Rhodococcus olei]|uniref:Adenylate/guanylate cyclase domain-containing protein n=1 Tax=Rhodococcus olei TaxID=2161675 RepID=A0ABP8NZP6_9NOCA